MDINLLLADYEYIEGRKEDFAREFYSRLFVTYPDTQDYFRRQFVKRNTPPALQMRLQEEKLMATLKVVLTGVKNADSSIPSAIEALGRSHASYGVSTEDLYRKVGECLIETFRFFMGVAFTPAAESSWIEAYTFLQQTMLNAAKTPV